VSDLARPGANVTGTTFFMPELNAKRMELLKEALPGLRRVAVFTNPDNPATPPILNAIGEAARAFGVEMVLFPVRGAQDLEGAFAAMAAQRVEGLMIMDEQVYFANAGPIAALAGRNRLPLIGPVELAAAGSLVAYGVNFLDMYRRTGFYVDRILKGAKPASLPVERATSFEMIVNLKTANAIGVQVPKSLVLRANRVIE
jgi:putative ABC transport system substrate-binding protein